MNNSELSDALDRAIGILNNYAYSVDSCPAIYDDGYERPDCIECNKKTADIEECWHEYVQINPFKINKEGL